MVSADLPCADLELLAPLRASAEFENIADRVAEADPADAWREDGLHYFVFQLHPNGIDSPPDSPPMAVFVMDREADEPVSAVTVTPLPDGREAQVTDLRQPDSGYTAPMPPASE